MEVDTGMIPWCERHRQTESRQRSPEAAFYKEFRWHEMTTPGALASDGEMRPGLVCYNSAHSSDLLLFTYLPIHTATNPLQTDYRPSFQKRIERLSGVLE